MRLFIATRLPVEDDTFYAALVSRLMASVGPRVLRPVPAGTTHVTHAFLGDVAEAHVAAIADGIRNAAVAGRPVDAGLGAPELLGGGRGPRALLVPVTGGRQALFDWQVDLTLALRRVPGLAHLALPKPPHATIARCARTATRRDGQRITEVLASLPDVGRVVRWVDVRLIRSTLTTSGPRYDDLARFEVGGGGDA